MAGKLDRVKDDGLRQRLEDVRTQLRENKPTDAVRTISDVFLGMLRDHPELLDVKVPIPIAGRDIPMVMRWPMLGANLDMTSVQERDPRIDFIRDSFALSEAITYYEFTVDTAIGQGL
jgi:hypothetical protein